MAKSKNRKGHAKKSSERTLILKRKKEKQQRELIDLIRGMQQKQMEEKSEETVNPNLVGVEELGNIGENLQIDDEK